MSIDKSVEDSGQLANAKRRKNLLILFLLLFVIAVVSMWTVFSGYSDSSAVKKKDYLLRFNLAELVSGEVRIIQHKGLPVVLMHREQQDLKQLLAIRSGLIDPDSNESSQPAFAKNYHRSLKPEYFIAYAINPLSGADINYRLESYQHNLKKERLWYGGFSEKRTGYLYDQAGRVYKQADSADAQRYNLYVPNYKITANNQLYVYTLKELDFD
ncbi:hypothetical protein MNBD_GAMMA23-2314 [hydrothermal vent metagenome]|uniref:Uncharacterized protein n=1 Tax=hydrothermal vent metagenome TaxID=652676 RepID=A0A3B0ZMA7_9ZZZZ